MSLMGSLYVGASGLQNHQNALNTTAHNLSNIDTKGYTRQQVTLASKSYVTLSTDPNSVANKQTGLGVSYSSVKQVRDYFLDKTYRKESGRSMFYQVTTEALGEVESLLGELDGEAFQITVDDLWKSIQELAKDPSSSITQGVLVQRASEFIERSVAVYEGLASYQQNLNQQIKQQVEQINKYGQTIVKLNDEIRNIESGGVEHANDLRDYRNLILDELSKLANISYSEDANCNVSVRIEGESFVSIDHCYEIGLDVDPTTGFYTPFWPQNASYTMTAEGARKYIIDGAEVFDLSREILSDLDTDIGGLKSMLHARGDHEADYTDIVNGNYDNISNSVVMNIEAEFDQLIHNVASKINEILAKAAGVTTGDITLPGGKILKDVKYCESDIGGYMRMEDGSPIQLFNKITTPGYEKVTDINNKEIWIYIEEDMNNDETVYSVKNLQINQALMQEPSKLGFMIDNTIDTETIDALKASFTEEIYKLNPNVNKRTTFADYYKDLVAQVANTGFINDSIYANQQTTVETVQNARDQVIGVSSDEELANMIKFQNAYNASSRYINVISELLEHIITTLGV